MVKPNPEVVFKGGTVVDSLGVRRMDVAVSNGSIIAVGNNIEVPRGATVIDAGGLVVAPGFVDIHSHLRQPGFESAETIVSGSTAGVLGGYTALLAMPNTSPAIDSPEMVRYVQALAVEAYLDVFATASITKGRKGESLVDMFAISQLGVHLFTDDGSGVQDAQLMRRALEYAKGIGVTLAQHCEDERLANGGSMNEGSVSSLLGVNGIPNAAEDVMVARDIELVRTTGAKMHFLHISTQRSAEMIATAREQGLPITAEVTPHHLCFTDSKLAGFNSIFKVNPPLRAERDRIGLWSAYLNGAIDAVATDHAPHPKSAKENTLADSAFGMIGLQAAFGAVFGELLRMSPSSETEGEDGDIATNAQMMHLIGSFTWRPAAIAGISHMHGGPIKEGSRANITVFDPRCRYRLEESDIVSRSRNSPYDGFELIGKVIYTMVNGELKVREGELCH